MGRIPGTEPEARLGLSPLTARRGGSVHGETSPTTPAIRFEFGPHPRRDVALDAAHAGHLVSHPLGLQDVPHAGGSAASPSRCGMHGPLSSGARQSATKP
jgi:hypothetical protein